MTRPSSSIGEASGQSLARRLMRTPLASLMRGDFGSDREAVARVIDGAALPASIRHLIDRVTHNSRLWRSEKIDVAMELIMHFRDGLEAGRSSNDLINDFGDPDQVAKLIRRAKRRNRPPWWRATRRTVQTLGIAVVTVIVIYLGLSARFYAGSPTITQDFFEQINAIPAAAPEDERGWPFYRSAIGLLSEDAELMRLRGVGPGEENWPIVRDRLPHHATTLEQIRYAASKPYLGFVSTIPLRPEDREHFGFTRPEYDKPEGPHLLIGMLLPHLSELRKAAQVFAADAHLAVEQSDGSRARDNIIAMLGIAKHVTEHPIIISKLVSQAIIALAINVFGNVLAEAPELLSDDDLQRIAHAIVAEIGTEPVSVDLSGERMAFADIVQHVYSDDGRGGGRLTPEGMRLLMQFDAFAKHPHEVMSDLKSVTLHLAGPGVDLLVADRREMMRKYDEIMSLMEREMAMPLWWATFESELEIQRLANSSILTRTRYFPIITIVPAIRKAGVNAELITQRRDAVQAAIALELYRRRHGDWPESLAELAPDLLPRVPVDRFDGRPLRYVVRDGQAVLYSIGSNHEDNGGRPAIGRDGEPQPDAASRWIPADQVDHRHDVPDGDWILWQSR